MYFVHKYIVIEGVHLFLFHYLKGVYRAMKQTLILVTTAKQFEAVKRWSLVLRHGVVWMRRCVVAECATSFAGSGLIQRCDLCRWPPPERCGFFLRALRFRLWALWGEETWEFGRGQGWGRSGPHSTTRPWIWVVRHRHSRHRRWTERRSRRSPKETFRIGLFQTSAASTPSTFPPP